MNNNKTIESCYPNNTGNLTMEISYITITTKYINNESEVIVDVHENSFNDVVGKVKLGLDSSQGADRSNEYKNIKEKVVDVLVDFNRTGSITTITLLTANGKAYTTPWAYRYNSTQGELFEIGNNVMKLSFDNIGGCGYDKNGNIVFHASDIYMDGP